MAAVVRGPTRGAEKVGKSRRRRRRGVKVVRYSGWFKCLKKRADRRAKIEVRKARMARRRGEA